MISLKLAKKLPKAAILVHLFIKEYGNQPIGKIAEACELSDASVYSALKALKKIRHEDHDLDLNLKEGTTQETGPLPPASKTPPPPADPLFDRLVAAGIFASTASELLAQFDRERLERHLDKHDKRKAGGFTYTSATPAVYLLRCIRQDKWPPASPAPGLQEARQRQRAEQMARLDTPERTEALVAPQQTELTREGAVTVLRLAGRSKLPHMRAEGLALAERFGIDPAPFGLAP